MTSNKNTPMMTLDHCHKPSESQNCVCVNNHIYHLLLQADYFRSVKYFYQCHEWKKFQCHLNKCCVNCTKFYVTSFLHFQWRKNKFSTFSVRKETSNHHIQEFKLAFFTQCRQVTWQLQSNDSLLAWTHLPAIIYQMSTHRSATDKRFLKLCYHPFTLLHFLHTLTKPPHSETELQLVPYLTLKFYTLQLQICNQLAISSIFLHQMLNIWP